MDKVSGNTSCGEAQKDSKPLPAPFRTVPLKFQSI